MAPPSNARAAGTWSLEMGRSYASPEQSFALDCTAESIFDPDYRCLADQNDFKDGAVVKLQMRYEGQDPDDTAYAMGTGWMIQPDLVVTAGRNVYDWSGQGSGLGRVVHMCCYIGYHGRDSVRSPDVQSRFGKRVVTTAEWLDSRENRHRDVAFVQLDRPFEGHLRLFSYGETPGQGNEMIGVVGYPADKTLVDNDGLEEKGAMMYEQFNGVTYNLEDSKNNPLRMLKYRVSTFGGQSGAPVIRRRANQVVIGTHVYGGGDMNEASVIGKYGNDYDALISVFQQACVPVGEHRGIKFVKRSRVADNTGWVPPTHPPSEETEGFFDVLKSISRVTTGSAQTVLSSTSPLLGPLGAPISAVAGAALRALADVSTDPALATAEQHARPDDTAAPGSGGMERAILAEASLQAVLRLDGDTPARGRVLDAMQQTYTTLAPDAARLAPGLLLPGLLDAACRITVGRQGRRSVVAEGVVEDRGGEEHSDTPKRLPLAGVAEADSCEGGGSSFLDGMLRPTVPVQGEEGFFDILGQFIRKGLEVSKPLLHEGVKAGLDLLDRTVAASGATVNGVQHGNSNPDARAAELLVKRAVVAEAALQAVTKLGAAELDRVTLLPQAGVAREEDFFDFVKGVVQTIGPAVVEVAPTVVGTVVPAVVSAVGRTSAPRSLDHVDDGMLEARGTGPPAAGNALVQEGHQPSSAASPRTLRHVDSNDDLPVIQEF